MSGRAHLLVALLSAFSVLFILHLVRKRQLRAKYALVWLSVGAVIVVLSASPSLLDRTSLMVGITYPPAFLSLGAMFFLFLVVIHFSWELTRLEERSRILAEELAILRAHVEAGSSRNEEVGSTRTHARLPERRPGGDED